MSDALSVLKYMGAIVAGATLLLGLYGKLSAGQWRVTRTDWLTVALAVAGVLVSITSIYVQENQAKQAVHRAREADAQRHRRELAGTPLRSLTIEWAFRGTPPRSRAARASRASSQTCNAEWEARREPRQRAEVYPFLASLGGAPSDTVVLLLALDDAPEPANVLPLGLLFAKVKREEDSLEWRQTTPASLRNVAATIEFAEDLDQCHDINVRNLPSPAIDRPRRCDPRPELHRDGDSVVVRWDLRANCIASGIDRTDGSSPPTALLPARMRALLFTQIGDFPRSPENFAKWGPLLPWESDRQRPGVFQDGSRLRLMPNGLQADAVEYEMRFHQPYQLGGKGGGAEVQHAYPMVAVWVSSPPNGTAGGGVPATTRREGR